MNRYPGRVFTALAALLLLSLLISCKKERFSLIFSHEKHVMENEMECSTCHHTVADGGMSRPDHAICSECHEIEEENPSAACLQCHKAKRPGEIEVRYPNQIEKREIVFSHGTHEYMDATCSDCHIRAAASTSSRDNILPPKEACLGCHNDETAPLRDCSVCHPESSPVNATHRPDWETQHGLESKFGNSKCLTCHREDTCIQCHQDEKPRDHNNTWRKITHGAEAGWNRSRCMVCHQEDFCDRCHRNTEPRSHTAGWATGVRSRHCFQCHFPTGFAGCSVCHESAEHPSASEPPSEPFHTPDADCRTCHILAPIGPPAPHPDPGGACTVCHEI